MAGLVFKKATKETAKLRLALAGPSGAGKTFTALTLATHLAQGGRIAVIDTERGSASKYADLFTFDTLDLSSFHPKTYIEAIEAAAAAGYAVLIIDSLSHAWMGKDGALELVDRAAKRSQSGNSFGAWREVTPLHNALVDALVSAPLHLIATLRSKQDYVQEKNERTGRTEIRKVGLAPVQRDGLEYEFDVFGEMSAPDNTLVVSKSRCPALSGAVVEKPGQSVAATLLHWLTDGAPALSAPAAPVESPVETPAKPPTPPPPAPSRNGTNVIDETFGPPMPVPAKAAQKADARHVTPDQVTDLTDQIRETATNLTAFKDYFRVARLEDLTEPDYWRAKKLLQDKLDQSRAKVLDAKKPGAAAAQVNALGGAKS